MDDRIGERLAAAREQRGIGLEQVEQELKIRRRYLLALEQEQWERLPAPTYARGFLRTYAAFLGLDAESMVEAYRRLAEVDEQGDVADDAPVPPLPPTPRRRRSRAVWLGLPWRGIVAVIAVVGVGLLVLLGGDDGSTAPSPTTAETSTPQAGSEPRAKPDSKPPTTLARARFTTTGDVWVCAVDEHGKPLIDGRIFSTGERSSALRGKRLELTFGNGQVDLSANGEPVAIDSPADPIGFRLTPGRVHELPAADRPTCT